MAKLSSMIDNDCHPMQDTLTIGGSFLLAAVRLCNKQRPLYPLIPLQGHGGQLEPIPAVLG